MMYDTRGSELGWLAAQVVPWLRSATTKDDMVVHARGFQALFSGVKGALREGSPLTQPPDMIGLALRKRANIISRRGVPCLDRRLIPKPYAIDIPRGTDIVLHCRGIPKCPERNWEKSDWDHLSSNLPFRPIVIGSKDDYCPPQAEDHRGQDLYATFADLRKARVVVGASSGPMHVAQMCEAPVVVWSGNSAKDAPRYQDVWNHFDTPVDFVAPTWSPMVHDVLAAIERML